MNFGFSFGYKTAGSTALANILYNMDTFNVVTENILGSELVDTANDATAWTKVGTNLIEQDVDGSIKITYVDNAIGGYVFLNGSGGTLSNLTVGVQYQVDIEVKVNSGSYTYILYNGSVYIANTSFSNTSYSTLSYTMTPTTTSPFIRIEGLGVGEIVNIKNISVKEVLQIPQNRTIDNAGSDGATSDASMYGSNHIYLGATQSVAYNIPNTGGANSFLTYFDVTSKDIVTLGNSVDGGSSIELVDTANNAADWTPYINNIIEQDGESVKITYVDWNEGGKIDLTQTKGLSQNVVVGKKYRLYCEMKVNSGSVVACMNDGVTQHKDEETISSTTYVPVVLFLDAVSTSPYLRIEGMGAGEIAWIKNISVKEILPISTQYTINTPTHHSNVFTTTAPVTSADRVALKANPEDIARMWYSQPTVGTYSFTKSDIYSFYPGNDDKSLQYVQNVAVDLGSELVTNGAFDTNVTGWVYSGTGTVVWESGAARVTAGATTAGGIFSSSDLPVTLGNTYLVKANVTVTQLTSGSINFQLFGNTEKYTITATGTYSVAFLTTITDNTTRFYGQMLSHAIGDNYLIDNISVKEVSATKITNYAASCRTTYLNTNYGASNRPLTRDVSGRVTGISTAGEYHGDGSKDIIPTRTVTANISIELTPRVVASILLVNSTTGDITMNANGTVTASSGSVAIDTTTLQVGVKSVVTVTGISISGASTLFENFDGTVHNYTEETV